MAPGSFFHTGRSGFRFRAALDSVQWLRGRSSHTTFYSTGRGLASGPLLHSAPSFLRTGVGIFFCFARFWRLATAPFSGFLVQSPLDALLSTVNLLLDGALLAMAYLSPLSKSFLKN